MNKIRLVSERQIPSSLSNINMKPTQEFDLKHIEITENKITAYFSEIFKDLFGEKWRMYGCVNGIQALIEITDYNGNKKYLEITNEYVKGSEE